MEQLADKLREDAMERLKQLKIVGALICSSMVFSAFAYTNANNPDSTTDNQQTTIQSDLNKNHIITDSTAIQLNDKEILAAVDAALAPYKDQVQVQVINGTVSLSGQVNSDTDYEKVITLTESIQGISDVNVDKLTVKESKQPLKDTYLTAKIKAALIRSDLMDKDIPSWTLGVETKNGEVYLSGQVASAEEKQAILKLVTSVKGVEKVNDKMEIAGEGSSS